VDWGKLWRRSDLLFKCSCRRGWVRERGGCLPMWEKDLSKQKLGKKRNERRSRGNKKRNYNRKKSANTKIGQGTSFKGGGHTRRRNVQKVGRGSILVKTRGEGHWGGKEERGPCCSQFPFKKNGNTEKSSKGGPARETMR